MNPYQNYVLPSYTTYQEKFDPYWQNLQGGNIKDVQQTKELIRQN